MAYDGFRHVIRMAMVLSLLGAWPTSGAADDESAPPENLSASLTVRVDRGSVTVEAHDVPLDAVLHALAKQAGLEVVTHGAATDHVTESFSGVDLDKAIQRLARGYDVVLVYGSAQSRANSLMAVHVYERPKEANPSTVDPQQRRARLQEVHKLSQLAHGNQPGALNNLAGMMDDPDPLVRRTVASALSGLEGPEAMAVLARGLGDQDPLVRSATVASIGTMHTEDSVATLARVAAQDPEAMVRRAAVWALAAQRSDAARQELEEARSDPDASVRQAAMGGLRNWERRARASAN